MMRRRCGTGMALIAVLWIVAALSVLVLGATATVHDQIRVAAADRDQVTGQALGEAAIALAVQQLQVAQERAPFPVSAPVAYAGQMIPVEVTPLDGLISLNGAQPPLFAALLQIAGGVPRAQAEALAIAMVAWRELPPDLDLSADAVARATPRRFEAPEDLLLIPGIDYDLYRRIAPLVSADLGSTQNVNLMAAPPGVLEVVSGGNPALVRSYLAQRAANGSMADTSGFNQAFIGGRVGELYRIQASVPLDAGRILVLTEDLSITAGYAGPWRLLREERQIRSAS